MERRGGKEKGIEKSVEMIERVRRGRMKHGNRKRALKEREEERGECKK